MHRIAQGAAAAHDVAAEVDIRTLFSVTVNDARKTERARGVAASVVGSGMVVGKMPPSLGSEDFADMLQVVPGAYLLFGHGGEAPLHHPQYQFDDAVLPMAASVLAGLVYTGQAPR